MNLYIEKQISTLHFIFTASPPPPPHLPPTHTHILRVLYRSSPKLISPVYENLEKYTPLPGLFHPLLQLTTKEYLVSVRFGSF